jgi:hypothetical protein
MLKALNLKNFSIFAYSLSLIYLLSNVGMVFALDQNYELAGYAWSSNIGWISFNCDQTDLGGTNECATGGTGNSDYAVSISASGILSGYAWSSNIGWISFNETSGFPVGLGTETVRAQLNSSETGLIGWARAIGPNANGVSGWDGWISMSGIANDTNNYQVTFDGDRFDSYAWGDDVMGWIYMNPDNLSGVRLKIKEPIFNVSCDILIEDGIDDNTARPGQEVELFADVSGATNPTYEWYEGFGTNNLIDGETSNSLIRTFNEETENTYLYTIQVTADEGVVTTQCGLNITFTGLPPTTQISQGLAIPEFEMSPSVRTASRGCEIRSVALNITSCTLYRNNSPFFEIDDNPSNEINSDGHALGTFVGLDIGEYYLECRDNENTVQSQVERCINNPTFEEF